MIFQRIKYFIKAADAGSYSKAANQLFITPQALAKQIEILEDEIGGKLLERSPKGITLTKLGEYAYRKFSKIDQELIDILDDLKMRSQTTNNKLNIGIFSPLPQDSFVTPMLSFILATYPDYQINLNMIDLFEGKKLIDEGKIDIWLTNIHDQDTFEHCRILTYKKFPAEIVVSLRHPWALKDRITMDDMMKAPFLKMDNSHSAYNISHEKSFYDHIPCKKVQKVSNFETMFTLLQQGEHFAVFPMFFSNMDTAKLKSFPYPGMPLNFYASLVYREDNPLQGFMELINDLKEEFELKEK